MKPEDLLNLLLGMLGFLLTGIASWFVVEVRSARQSIEELNVNVAKVIERLELHEERIDRLENSINGKLNG
jgi:hypothetical protein